MRDFNSRASDLPDFTIEKVKELPQLPTGCQVDNIVSRRYNEDATGKHFEKELIDLCIACSLMILNERTSGGFARDLSLFSYNVLSTIDLILVPEYTLANTNSVYATR